MFDGGTEAIYGGGCDNSHVDIRRSCKNQLEYSGQSLSRLSGSKVTRLVLCSMRSFVRQGKHSIKICYIIPNLLSDFRSIRFIPDQRSPGGLDVVRFRLAALQPSKDSLYTRFMRDVWRTICTQSQLTHISDLGILRCYYLLITTSASFAVASRSSRLSRSPITVETVGYFRTSRAAFASSLTSATGARPGCVDTIKSSTAPPT